MSLSVLAARTKKNIRNLKRHVGIMPESNEKLIFNQIVITLDNMRLLIGDTRLLAGETIHKAVKDMKSMKEHRKLERKAKEDGKP